MHVEEANPGRNSFRAREAVIIGAVLAVVIGFVAVFLYSTRSDVASLQALSPSDRTAFIRSECETLRSVCRTSGAYLVPSCSDRAKTLLSLTETDPACRALAESVAAPTR